MSLPSSTPRGRGPTQPGARITNLDAVRGVAVLGILPMNVVSYALVDPAYFNVDSAGSNNALDRAIGLLGEVFVDQKFMGLFSMLFGAGIVLFADRAAAKRVHPVLLSIWRNVLLLGIGLFHAWLWEGDVLIVYALCAPILILVRKLPPALLVLTGAAVFLAAPIANTIAQATVDEPSDLANVWVQAADPEAEPSDEVGLALLVDFFARALGMMLIGAALYRLGVLNGTRPAAFYRRLAGWGLGIGIPLAVAGAAWMAVDGWSIDVALVGSVPNSLATIPMVLGYLGVITLWNAAPDSPARLRIRAVGRMALTNYLAQTGLGLAVFSVALGAFDASRTTALAFVVVVWALELWWSTAWLERFRFGPVEWLWRTATYFRLQPIVVDQT